MTGKVVDILDNFTNIGKAVLLQAIGLQKNYTEIKESTVEVIDYNNAACSDCKYRAILNAFEPNSEACEAALEACKNCPRKVFTTETIYKKVYHNEKNRYAQNSYKPRLKANAVKLLLALHFYHPDRFGIIKNIDIRELASLLECDIKTIRNNLCILNKYSYITYSKPDTYLITVYLNDYENYYLPAKKGGRGFFVMSFELFKQILKIRTLVTLRIYLRELIDIDNLNISGGPFTAVSKSFKDIKQSLPDYCKPHVIKKAVQQENEIFDITLKEFSVRFEIKDEYNSKQQKEKCYNYYIEKFTAFISEFNNTAVSLNVNNIKPEKYAFYFDAVPTEYYHLLHLKDFEIEDLAMLSIQYSYDTVLYALSSVYKTYILNDRKINNLGGLVRTVINSQLNTLYLAA